MNEGIKYVGNLAVSQDRRPAALFGKERAVEVRNYHRSFSAYEPTALRSLAGDRDCGTEQGGLHLPDDKSR